MANTQATFGFRHIGYLGGGGPDYQIATRPILATNTTKIFMGDPVVKSGAYVIQALTSNNTSTIEGIFQGCVYVPVGGGIPQWSPFWPGTAASDATAYIMNAPNAIFLAAALNTAIPTTAIANNITFNTGTGSTAGGGFSGATVDFATITSNVASTVGYPFQIVSMYQGIGNGSDTTTAYNWVVVTFNNQRFKQLTAVS